MELYVWMFVLCLVTALVGIKVWVEVDKIEFKLLRDGPPLLIIAAFIAALWPIVSIAFYWWFFSASSEKFRRD